MFQKATKYPFTTILLVVIWVLCFIPIPESPLSHVSFIDKWTHIAMYFVLSVSVMYEYQKTHTDNLVAKYSQYAWLLPVVMGGVIEILQAYCTGGRRSGEWLDFAADALGSTIALLIGILLVRCRAKA